MCKTVFLTFLIYGVSIGNVACNNQIHQTQYLYTLMTSPATWLAAFDECNRIGGGLASNMNPDLDDNVKNFLVTQNFEGTVWTGARVVDDDGMRWKWESANVFMTFNNFRSDANCGATIMDRCLVGRTATENFPWGWCGESCDTMLPFVCEFRTDATPTTPGTGTPSSTVITTSPTTPIITTNPTTTPPTTPIITSPTTSEITNPTTTPPTSSSPPPHPSYVLMNIQGTWGNAFRECDQIGGRLVAPMNPSLDDALRQFLITQNFNGTLWLGARVVNEGGFRWKWESTDVFMTWNNFRDENCGATTAGNCLTAQTATESFGWNWCGTSYGGQMSHFVCEFGDVVTNPPTTASSSTVEITTKDDSSSAGYFNINTFLVVALLFISLYVNKI